MATGDYPDRSSVSVEWNPDDARDLQRFVSQVQGLLQAVVDDGRFIPEEFRDDVALAWLHAKADLDDLHDGLAFERVRDLAEPRGPRAQPGPRSLLLAHGLTGPPLRMKLRGWRSHYFSFGRRMNRRWLRSVLRWSDTILESIVDAMTLGAAGKEFKQSIENFVADAD